MKRDELARFLANYGTGNVQDIDADPEDIRAADYLLDRIQGKHGYSLFFRRLIGGLFFAVLAAILILTAHQGAH